MNEKLIALAKSFLGKMGQTSKETDEEMTTSRARLQQINEKRCARTQELLKKVELEAEDALEFRLRSAQETTGANQSVGHWSKDPDRHMKQKIRGSDEMGGVANGFEIDPVSRLPAEKT